jgi:hypothetical protein
MGYRSFIVSRRSKVKKLWMTLWVSLRTTALAASRHNVGVGLFGAVCCGRGVGEGELRAANGGRAI